ncbi:MAG: hypothetical protein E3J43_08625, partial [Candidatus Heimdallarchaeota archaeon]
MKRNHLRRSPLQTPINSPEFMRTFTFDRAPLPSDYRSFKISDLWIHRSPEEIPKYGYYVLVDKPNKSAVWINLGATEEGSIHEITGDLGDPVIPDSSSNVNIVSGSDGVVFTGSDNTLTLTVDGAEGDIMTLTCDTGDPVTADSNGNINVIGSGGVTTFGSLNTITISHGVITWNEITDESKDMELNNGYISNNSNLVTLTLPVNSSIGDFIMVDGKGAGGWKIAQNAGQTVHF